MIRKLKYQTFPLIAVSILFIFSIILSPGCQKASKRQVQNGSPKASQRGKKPPWAQRKRKPELVKTAQAVRKDISDGLEATSTLYSEKNVTIHPEINGFVKEIYHDVGDWVQEGTVLILLDDEEAKIQYEKAKLRKEQLEREYNRQKRLLDEGLVSQEVFDQTSDSYHQALLDYETARVTYERTRIRAPIDGQIVNKTVTIGQYVTPQTAVMQIVHTKELYGIVFLPERDYPRIRLKQDVEIRSDLFPDKVFHGKVDQISPVIDEQTGTFKVRFRVDIQPDDSVLIRPGMFVRIFIVTDTKKDALVIPKSGLLQDKKGYYVYIVENGKAKRMDVSIGIEKEEVVEILSGLEEGDQVIIQGQAGLQPGQPVQTIGQEE